MLWLLVDLALKVIGHGHPKHFSLHSAKCLAIHAVEKEIPLKILVVIGPCSCLRPSTDGVTVLEFNRSRILHQFMSLVTLSIL